MNVKEKITALVISPDPSRTEAVSTVFSTLPGFDVRVEGAGLDDYLDQVRELAPDVVVVFLGEEPGASYPILEQIKAARKNLFAFAVSNERNAELVVKAIRAGADELLSAMPTERQLLSALVKIVERRKQSKFLPHSENHVITLYSPHGGTGVTTIAVNLAIALRRLSGEEVVLVDLDLQSGETPIYLNFEPAHTILDLHETISELDPLFLKGVLYAHSSGVHVLAPPPNLEDSEMVLASEIEKTLEMLRASFRFVVVDTAAYLNEINLAAIEKADTVYLVLDNSVTTVRAARRALDTLARLGVDERRFEILMNKPYVKSAVTPKDVAKALQRRVSHCLPRDEATAVMAANQGIPLAEVQPRSPLVGAIDSLARSETGISEVARPARSLLGRLFSEARS